MRIQHTLMALITAALTLVAGSAAPQMASDTLFLTGSFIPGGGTSASTAYRLTGAIGSGPTGLSASGAMNIYGGVVGGVGLLEPRAIANIPRPAAMPEAGYRIVGVPVTISGNPTPAAVFADDLGAADNTQWRLGRYTAAGDQVIEYPTMADDVTPGRGFWLIARHGRSYDATGTYPRPWRYISGAWYYPVLLDSGWNQLANPFPFDVDWQDVRFQRGSGPIQGHTAAFLEDAAHCYNGAAYVISDQIVAWEGFFVRVDSADVTALFKYEEYGVGLVGKTMAATTAASIPGAVWSLELSLAANGKTDAGNLLGVHPQAVAGPDRLDFSEPPRAPEAPRLGFRIEGDDGRMRRTDFRPSLGEGTVWNLVWSDEEDRQLTVTGVENLPADVTAVLVLDVGTVIPLTEDVTVALPKDSHTGQIVAGSSQYAGSLVASLLPEDFELHQNFPNPFNPETSIRFGLPVATHVTLTVYNTLGQQVSVLADAPYPAGRHTIVWDGRNYSGMKVASGVYFYRLEAGSFNATKKMLLVK